jgi:hypothetical protein
MNFAQGSQGTLVKAKLGSVGGKRCEPRALCYRTGISGHERVDGLYRVLLARCDKGKQHMLNREDVESVSWPQIRLLSAW